jgi:CHAT domain-containing protein/tetratricopeptide (TPR) repeat protein
MSFLPLAKASEMNERARQALRFMPLEALLIGIAVAMLGFFPGSAATTTIDFEPPEPLKAAEAVYRTDGPEAALPEFLSLEKKYRDIGEPLAEATAVRFIGEIYWRLGDFDQAEDRLQTALAMTRSLGDRYQQAKTLNVQGLLYWELGDYEEAISRFGQAAELADALGDPKMQGAVLNNTSLVFDELGEYRRSLHNYRQALELYGQSDFPRGEGDTLGNIGGVYLLLGRYRESLEYYRQALQISTGLQSVTAMSQDHGNLALCYLGLGDAVTAVKHFDRAIELAGQAGSQQDMAYWQRGKANALIRLGRHGQGLGLHRKAVEAYTNIGAGTEAVEAMHDIGELYLSLGDPESAVQWFDRSMEQARDIGLARGVTINLLSLGDLQVRREALEEAAALYTQAWQRARESGELWLQADSLLRLSAVHRQLERPEEAELEAVQALKLADEIGSPFLAASALGESGELKREAGDDAAAARLFRQALERLAPPRSPELAWRLHHGLGLALAGQGDREAAISELQQAIVHIESVRDRLTEQRFRAGFVQDKYQVYIDLVRIQMEAGNEEEAFSTAERLRSRSYADLVSAEFTGANSITEQQREAELKARIRQLRRALQEEGASPAGQRRQPALQIYSEELIAAEQAYQSLLDDHASTARRDARSNRPPTYAEVRQRLQPGEALVEYVVAEDHVIIFVLTRENLQATRGDLARANLHSKVELLRDLIRRPESDRWYRPAASLAAALVDPVRETGALDAVSDLYLVPHDSLNYLPFALLPAGPDGDRLLVQDFTITYLPTAAALMGIPNGRMATENLLAMAPARSGLRYAEQEAAAVFELFQPDSRLLVGEAATESVFKQEAGRFDVLHLATHGYFNKLNPLLSGLELEADADNDGLLELHEIIGMDLNADLVTLSACQTGLGSGHFAEIPPGDDFVGLTRAFLYAGSGSVMATLWEVDDESTADLMQNFYTQLRGPAVTRGKAAALADAQRQFRASRNYNHPYYWAPFMLMGVSKPREARETGSLGA